MTEKQLETKFVMEVKRCGGMCPKFVSPGMSGMPDRIAMLRDGKVGFVEVKAPGQKPRAQQLKRHAQLRALGFQVFVLDDPEQIPVIIHTIEGGDAK